MTYEALVEACKALRLKAERADAEFFAFLLRVEVEEESTWQEAGCATFEQFVVSNHLCDFARYRFFAIGVERVGLQGALENGAYWTMQAGKMRDPAPDVLERFSQRARAFVELEKTSPAEETVQAWARELASAGRESQKIRQVSELHRLRAEVQELRARVRRLEVEKGELEKRLAVGKGKKARQEARA